MLCQEKVTRTVLEGKLIAIVRGMDPAQLTDVAEALYQGGIRMMECTFDHRREDCVEANQRMISSLVNHFGDRMLVGSGTVLTTQEVQATLDAGGSFIISPSVDEAVIKETRRLGAVSMPGALTPTEIMNAWNAGAHFVKLFPAGDFGPGYVKAVRAPLAHIPMLAVGGITPENIPAFLKSGVCGFGVGGPLLPKEAVAAGDYEAICRRVQEFVSAVAN